MLTKQKNLLWLQEIKIKRNTACNRDYKLIFKEQRKEEKL